VVLALHADHVGARETVAHHFAADVFLDLSLLVRRVVRRTTHDDRDHVGGLFGRQLARLTQYAHDPTDVFRLRQPAPEKQIAALGQTVPLEERPIDRLLGHVEKGPCRARRNDLVGIGQPVVLLQDFRLARRVGDLEVGRLERRELERFARPEVVLRIT
jgi:hypothetical protein